MAMRNERIDAGQLVAGLGAALIFAALFTDWYGFERGIALSGWAAFEFIDIFLAATALIAVAAIVPIGGTAVRRHGATARAALPYLGAIALVMVVVNILDKPPAARGGSLEIGVWLALVGALLLLAGVVLAARNLSVVIRVGSSTEHPAETEPPAPQGERPGTAPTQVQPPTGERPG